MPISSARSFAPAALTPGSAMNVSPQVWLDRPETNGLGGFANACRTIPIARDRCRYGATVSRRSAAELTNPSGMVTEAILRHSRIKAVGLCNVPVIMQKDNHSAAMR